MPAVIITYEAKCKHCKFFEYRRTTKKNGEPSKVYRPFCNNHESKHHNEQLTLKVRACDKLEL